MFEFKMPSMGADMENGILVQWNYGVGDRVEKGDIICEIETAKGNIDVEIWESGTVAEILVEPGTKIPVGEVMARLATEASQPAAADEPGQVEPEQIEPEPVEPEQVEPEQVEPEQVEPEPVEPEPVEPEQVEPEPVEPEQVEPEQVEPEQVEPEQVGSGGAVETEPPRSADTVSSRTSASPVARRRAAELGLSLDAVTGSGPGGVIKLADVEAAAGAGGRKHHRVTPVARRMAADAGVDVDTIAASGAHDTVTKADVQDEVARRKSPADPQAALRDAIARAMSRSKREIPHYYLRTVADVTETVQWLAAQNEDRSVRERLVFGALAARAVALAAAEVPSVNGFYTEDVFHPSDPVHVGFAVAMRGGGVVAPAIHHTDQQTLDETMAAVKDLVRRVRGGKLRSSEMTDPTITLTSLGELGVDTVFGIIYPPQVAIVGVGSPREIPVATDGMVGVRTCVDLTLSGDHRVSDGLVGAKFLQLVETHLQNPESL